MNNLGATIQGNTEMEQLKDTLYKNFSYTILGVISSYHTHIVYTSQIVMKIIIWRHAKVYHGILI